MSSISLSSQLCISEIILSCILYLFASCLLDIAPSRVFPFSQYVLQLSISTLVANPSLSLSILNHLSIPRRAKYFISSIQESFRSLSVKIPSSPAMFFAQANSCSEIYPSLLKSSSLKILFPA